MDIGVDYRVLDLKPTSDILEYDISSLAMIGDTPRSKLDAHKQTISYPFLWHTIRRINGMSTYTLTHKSIDDVVTGEFGRAVAENVRLLEDHLNSVAILVTIAGVLPHGDISEHIDMGEEYAISHRVHLPLVTDDRALFHIGGNEYHFPKGSFVEINNKRMHGVHNGMDTNRLHLLVDLMPRHIYELKKNTPMIMVGGM